MEETNQIKLPVVLLSNLTVFPKTIVNFDLNKSHAVVAAEQAMRTSQKIFLVTRKNENTILPSRDDVYDVGTIAILRQMTKLSNGTVRVLTEGICRGKLVELENVRQTYMNAVIETIDESADLPDEVTEEAMLRLLKEKLEEYAAAYHSPAQVPLQNMRDEKQLSLLLNQIAVNLPLSVEAKQNLLEAGSDGEKYMIMADVLTKENEIAAVRLQLAQRIKGNIEKNQKEFILREQLKCIKNELGGENELSDTDQLREAVKELTASDEVKSKINKEIRRLDSVAGSSSESAMQRTYIETLLEMPWDLESEDNEEITHAEEILDRDHYGLTQVKDRIIEFIAVRTLNHHGDCPIICLVGPPGTGKTSIARSVAEALNKKYIRICLGGVRDEAEIRGHRKTYIGAMPGRIAAGLKQAGVGNPLILLDEIDKLGNDYKGDPSSALLEVLDSEQNTHFHDHYIDFPLNLSKVLFIATANDASGIPRPLLDRMEMIEISSYTENEKFHILKEHLFIKQLLQNGLKKTQLKLNDDAAHEIIRKYTREAGVRELERKLGRICRRAAKELLAGDRKSITVTVKNLEKYLDIPRFEGERLIHSDEAGIVNGLAWTSVGGDVLRIETGLYPGKGELKLTGQLGDIMKESAMIALSFVRSIASSYGVEDAVFRKTDIHIHVPQGAVPKDGPSAGITMAICLLSAFTKKKVKWDTAMTGEITLRGLILPIGGLKEKLLAAVNAGILTVIVPKDNRKDVSVISEEITGKLNIVYVERMEEAVGVAMRD